MTGKGAGDVRRVMAMVPSLRGETYETGELDVCYSGGGACDD